MNAQYRLAIFDEYQPPQYGVEMRTRKGKWLALCNPNMTLKEAIAEVKALANEGESADQ